MDPVVRSEDEAVEALRDWGLPRHCLIDLVREVQVKFGFMPEEAAELIASEMGISSAELKGVASFYHFFGLKPVGRIRILVSTGAAKSMNTAGEVAEAFSRELGIEPGEVTPDGEIGLDWTSCIGMSDQEPAALIDGFVFTNLTPEKARLIVSRLRSGASPQELAAADGEGRNASPLIRSMVKNNIRKAGPVILTDHTVGAAVRKAVQQSPEDVLEAVRKSGLRGRGGAGFPTAVKWEACRNTQTNNRVVICNADEGEPGTFKDRVLLTEYPELLVEGMVTAAYAIGARRGIIYLRGEYLYLKRHLENVLKRMRDENLLGPDIAGRQGFYFDISIQMGAGAYICGEETALIESAEGKRGEPRERPPYPVTSGLAGYPTAVNNVETLCCAARIVENGPDWFAGFGTEKSKGTKVLSISGDCSLPGIYEVPFGTSLSDVLREAGGTGAQAVQVGGPSGTCVPPHEFSRRIAFEDLATGGAVIVIGPQRDLIEVIRDFAAFFRDESCGRCTPCRVGTTLMLNKLEKILKGRATRSDLEYMASLSKLMKNTSRCGLGQTAPNPVLSTLTGFPSDYARRLREEEFVPDHDVAEALRKGKEATGRL